MSGMQTYFIIIAAAVICGFIIMIIRSPGTIKKLAASMALGLASFAAVDLLSAVTGVFIAVSGWTVAAAAVLGLPGVISMLVVKMIWQI